MAPSRRQVNPRVFISDQGTWNRGTAMRRLMAGLALAVLLAGAGAAAETVKASAFGYAPDDATTALQAAIDSGAAVVIVDDVGGEWLSGPLQLRSDLELVIADGVTLRAKPGLFTGVHDSLLSAANAENIVVRGGPGAALKMNKADYQDAQRYAHSEWRHGVALRSCVNVAIRDLRIEGSGGDGVYIGVAGAPGGCRDVTLDNLDLADHHRQGVSVISAENLLIQNCRVTGTAGTAPMCGIDFEPNRATEYLVNCRVVDCDLSDNERFGALVFLPALDATSRPVSITFENCRVENNRGGGIRIDGAGAGGAPVAGKVEVVATRLVTPHGEALRLNNLCDAGVAVTLRDVTIDNRGAPNEAVTLASQRQDDVAGIDLGNLEVRENAPRGLLRSTGLGAAGVTGLAGQPTLRVGDQPAAAADLAGFIRAHAPDPRLKGFAVLPFTPRAYGPVAGAKPVAPVAARLRGANRFAQYVPAGGTVDIAFTLQTLRGAPMALAVAVSDPAGTPHDRFVVDRAEFTYPLRATAAGVYVLEIQGKPTDVYTLASPAPGQGLPADRPIWFFKRDTEWYFVVGAGDTAVRVEVNGEEPLKAELFDQAGRRVAGDNERADGNRILFAERKPTDADVIWKLKLSRVVEDHRIRLGAPLLPLLATAPENLLAVRRGDGR